MNASRSGRLPPMSSGDAPLNVARTRVAPGRAQRSFACVRSGIATGSRGLRRFRPAMAARAAVEPSARAAALIQFLDAVGAEAFRTRDACRSNHRKEPPDFTFTLNWSQLDKRGRPSGAVNMTHSFDAIIEQAGPSTSKATVRSHTVYVDRPTTAGGADAGPRGGELLLVAAGGCFMTHLLAAIGARGADISDVKVAVNGTLAGCTGTLYGDHPDRLGELSRPGAVQQARHDRRTRLSGAQHAEAVDAGLAGAPDDFGFRAPAPRQEVGMRRPMRFARIRSPPGVPDRIARTARGAGERSVRDRGARCPPVRAGRRTRHAAHRDPRRAGPRLEIARARSAAAGAAPPRDLLRSARERTVHVVGRRDGRRDGAGSRRAPAGARAVEGRPARSFVGRRARGALRVGAPGQRQPARARQPDAAPGRHPGHHGAQSRQRVDERRVPRSCARS